MTVENNEERYKKLAEELDAKVREQTKQLMEKELFQEIGIISSELAHDLRGPLQTIRNCTYLLEMDPDKKEYLDHINDAVRYASNLLDSFREYYRGHEIKPSETSIEQIIDIVLSDITIPPEIEIVKDLDRSIGKVTVDPTRTRRAIYNLVKNAVEAMPEGGRLTVSTEDSGENFAVRVGDTGTGIPEDIRDDLFKPFGSRKGGGSGLGLPSARRVVVAHGGEITYESDEGKGTTFTVVLPKHHPE